MHTKSAKGAYVSSSELGETTQAKKMACVGILCHGGEGQQQRFGEIKTDGLSPVDVVCSLLRISSVLLQKR